MTSMNYNSGDRSAPHTPLLNSPFSHMALRLGQTSTAGLVVLGIGGIVTERPALADPINISSDAEAKQPQSLAQPQSAEYVDAIAPNPSDRPVYKTDRAPLPSVGVSGDFSAHLSAGLPNASDSSAPRLSEAIGVDETDDFSALNQLFGDGVQRLSAPPGSTAAFAIDVSPGAEIDPQEAPFEQSDSTLMIALDAATIPDLDVSQSAASTDALDALSTASNEPDSSAQPPQLRNESGLEESGLELEGRSPIHTAQAFEEPESSAALDSAQREGSSILGSPEIRLQGVYLLQGDESSARARVSAIYAFNPYVLVGATVDLTTGTAFADSREEGLNLNELYVAASPPGVPNLRFVAGLLDLTSYFDRNSFAKDAATHFFNPVFQTNPALSAAGITTRPGLLVNFDVTDNLAVRAATFSSTRNLGDFELDGFAGEVGLRAGTAILRATYVTAEDEGEGDGFREIFDVTRNSGRSFGVRSSDRESGFGLNGEVFIPDLNLGLFGRLGWYDNQELDQGGQTFSLGMNLLDVFLEDDRLGLGYGRQLSNTDLRRDRGDPVPDVLELFYDARITRNLRAGVTLQQRDGFSETIAGFRIRVDFDARELGRL